MPFTGFHALKPLRALPFLWLTLSACSNFSEVSVSSRNFDDEIEQTQNLVFTFSKDLVGERDLDNWSATPYVEFTPSVPGKFRWTAPNELVFSPATAFAPATTYRAELSDRLLDGVKDKGWRVSGDDLDFHTPFLQATAPEVYWTKARSGQPVARVKLAFNYPVSPNEVASRLKAEVDGQSVLAQVSPTMAAPVIPVTLPDVRSAREAKPLKITLAEGLGIPNTAFKSDKVIELNTSLPSPFLLEVVDVQSGFENGQGFVRVVTTQELRTESLEGGYQLNGTAPEPETRYDSLGNPIKTPPPVAPQLQTRAELTENGFILRGDFNESDTYTLTLNEQLSGVLGAKLTEPQTKDVFFGKMPARIAFAHRKAIYLPANGTRNIGVDIVNLPKVTVKISRLYENNLLLYLRRNRYAEYDENTGEPSKSYSYNDDYDGSLTDVLVNKKVDTDNLARRNGVSVLNLTMPGSEQSPGLAARGVYLVSVASDEEYYQRDTRLVSISDIGLMARQSADEVLVFANSIQTAKPLSGVEINLVSTNNQTFLTGKTDADGIARFKDLKTQSGGFKLALLSARTNEDFNYLLLDDAKVETSRYDVEGRRDHPSGFEAFVYGDRDIYRPGETIHLNTVLRTQAWETVGKVPLKIKLLQPNGREYQSFRLETNEQGAADLAVPLDRAVVTGNYTAEIYNGNDVLLASKSLSVEEFMPDRIKVDVVSDRETYQAGQTVLLSSTATNLFGPPAADRNYEMELQLTRKAFAPKGFQGYAFDIEDNTQFEKVLRQGRTDAQGRATERFTLPDATRDVGVLEGKVYVTIFDETGRPVNRLKRFDVYTQPVLYGIGLSSRYVGTGAPLPIPLVALDPAGKAVDASAQVDILRIDYQTVIEKQGDQLRYVSRRQPKVVYSRAVAFKGGKGQVSYTPTLSGEYEIRVARPGAKAFSAVTFYAYGYGSTQATSFEVDNEGRVDMTFDKEKYSVGDRVRVLFKTPFAGKLLISVERNKVLETHVLDTDQQSAEWSFKLSDAHLPNVYVAATLIRPMDGPNLPLTVAHGYAGVTVEKSDNKLPVEVRVAQTARSKTRQRVTVKTSPNAEVTVAVVDEGILQLKNFRTPDIHGYFYAKRALEVGGFDLYPFLFPELSIRSNSSVGGDGYNLEKRINPLANGRVNLVAFWSGQLKADGSGEASFEVDIPQFSGDLRVMAVAYKNEAFGSGNANVKVADPLVLSTALPRFLSPGDEVTVPVSLTNTTKKIANATATLTLSGALEAVNGATQTVMIAPGREGRAMFSIRAKSAIGTGSVLVTVKGLNETFTEKISLSVRPAASLVKTATSGQVAGGQTVAVNLPSDFLPSTVRSQVLVSRSPLVAFADAVQGLLGYPYGCLEQTVSKAFPQLYIADFLKTLKAAKAPTGANDQNPNATVQAAIRKLETLQLGNGGLSRWQAGDAPDAWSSAYAAHFLLEAQKADFEVTARVLVRLLDYLTAQSSTPATETEAIYNADGSISNRRVAKREVVYSLYVLALAGKPNRAVMNFYKASPTLLTPDERYLLAATYAQAGDQASLKALLPKTYPNDRTVRETGGSLSSPVRNVALTLNSLIETDANNIQIPALARLLSTQLKNTPYLNTQETAFATLALGKLARRAAQSTATATVLSNGQAVGTFSGTDLVLTKNLGQNLALRTAGRGTLYYFAQREGLSASGKVEELDNFLRVRRTFLTRDGQPLSEARFQQNQLVVVKITVESTSGLTIDNVVVTDLLPAGLEVENPRLTAERELSWVKDQSTPEHFDLRDDRINYFTSVDAKPRTFYYLARAVSRGKFILGPASADAMYRGEYRSYHGAGVVVIE
ncbi:MAG: alpha-2-macroglobulin family protein [Cytophagaceae bacterium]|nr:alpha-2-macroglobulin family protein [Cytophagaceae bacterium]